MTIAAGFARTSLGAVAAPAATPTARRKTVLTVVPSREPSGSRAPFVVAVVSLMVAGLLGLLVLNTVVAKDSFRLHTLQVEGRKLADREQALTREVEALRAPSALAAKASAMGMVQAGPPAFLRLPDGTVLGSATPAEAPTEDGAAAPGAAAAPAASTGDEDEDAATGSEDGEPTTAAADSETTADSSDSDADSSESKAADHEHPPADGSADEDPEDG